MRARMKNAVIYIHGKGGNADEAYYYKKFFSDEYDVIGFDYKSELPWEAEVEFPKFFDSLVPKYREISLIANSIGVYYSLLSLANKPIKKAMFISPIVDMEKLILNMMAELNISEEQLYKEKIITTSLNESLSWEYFSYARNHPITWNIPSHILYAGNDNITSLETMRNFANHIGASMTVMHNGEHWFHTEEQLAFLDNWFKKLI